MQFRLWTLLAILTVTCVIFGTIVAPPLFAAPMLAIILWTTPAFWLCGAVYSSGSRRAFFLGGIVAGIVPYIAAVILSILYYAQWIDDGDLPSPIEQADAWSTLRMALAVYLPGACSLIGGILGLTALRRANSS